MRSVRRNTLKLWQKGGRALDVVRRQSNRIGATVGRSKSAVRVEDEEAELLGQRSVQEFNRVRALPPGAVPSSRQECSVGRVDDLPHQNEAAAISVRVTGEAEHDRL